MGVGEAIERAITRLDPGARVVEWVELPGGTSACVCRVDLRTGAGDARRVVFRQHRAEFKGHGHAVAAVEHGVLTALWRRGFEVPEPFLLDDGGGVAVPSLVTEWIDGTTEVDTSQLSAALAQMADFLARLHALDPSDISIDVAGLEALEDPALALPELLPADRAGDRVREALATGEITHERVRPVLLHGDYWPGNVMWRDGRLVAVLDWEDVRIGDPVADLACARVELLCGYGPDAMRSFTEQYLERCAALGLEISQDGLPLWEVYVSVAALASMGAWGLDPDEESRRRRATREFFDRATADLLDS